MIYKITLFPLNVITNYINSIHYINLIDFVYMIKCIIVIILID